MREQFDKVAIVTGASSGIGEAAAICLAEAGYHVALVARRGILLDALADRIAITGVRTLALPIDLADGKATGDVVAATVGTFGRVDLLVNNAGFDPAGALEQLTRDQVRRAFEVNLLSALQLIAEVTPVMRHQGGGRIINVSSLSSRIAVPLSAPYAATKGAMEAATDCLRLELAPWNIRLSLVVPGLVDTPRIEKTRAAASALRADPSNPYRKLMLDLEERRDARRQHAPGPVDVGALIERVARSRAPKARYYIPSSARLASRVMAILPEKWADRLLERIYGVAQATDANPEVPARPATR